MPKVEVEVLFTRVVTTDEAAFITVTVPQDVIDNGDVLDWVENNVPQADLDKAAEVNDESEELTYDSADVVE